MTAETDFVTRTGATVVTLVEIDYTTPLRVCNGSRPFYLDGDEYTPRDLSVRLRYLLLGGSITIELDDPTGSLASDARSEDPRGCDLTVTWLVGPAWNDHTLWSGVVAYTATPSAGKWQVVGDGAGQLRAGPALPVMAGQCLWEFKGTGCGYSGGETACDGTHARCVALSNQARFVSGRWAPHEGRQIRLNGTGVSVRPMGGL
jgi:hypothetical protein